MMNEITPEQLVDRVNECAGLKLVKSRQTLPVVARWMETGVGRDLLAWRPYVTVFEQVLGEMTRPEKPAWRAAETAAELVATPSLKPLPSLGERKLSGKALRGWVDNVQARAQELHHGVGVRLMVTVNGKQVRVGVGYARRDEANPAPVAEQVEELSAAMGMTVALRPANAPWEYNYSYQIGQGTCWAIYDVFQVL